MHHHNETLLRRRPDGNESTSSVECSGSAMVPASGSPNTEAASSNETPCSCRLRAALFGSHSNFTSKCYCHPRCLGTSWSAERADQRRGSGKWIASPWRDVTSGVLEESAQRCWDGGARVAQRALQKSL